MGSIFPSQFSSTFDMDKLGKIHPFCWKEDFLISKIAKFANDLLKTNEDIGPQSPKILQMFVLWVGGHKLATNHANLCKFLQLCGGILYSLTQYVPL